LVTTLPDSADPEAILMRCTIENCAGEYEEREIVHTVRHLGRVIVFDHVPAEVCPVCGDVLLRPEVVRRIETMLQRQDPPAALVPLYEYAHSA
jgi:YgiT-type zinc finger domain-containing protein